LGIRATRRGNAQHNRTAIDAQATNLREACDELHGVLAEIGNKITEAQGRLAIPRDKLSENAKRLSASARSVRRRKH
jgi:hypothetical protein